jgi:hypothetical protein
MKRTTPPSSPRGLTLVPSTLAASSTLAACALVAACAGPSQGAGARDKFFDPPTGAAGVTSSTDAERWFPLVDGTVFHYETENEAGERGVLIARVHRTDATHGELIFPTGKKRFSFTAQGVRLEPAGDLVLASPIAQGASFRGQNGGRAVIEDVGLTITVKAGSYRDCIRVIEERGGDKRARYSTTYCPDVGIVALEAQSGMSFERAELVSAGPAVNIERDGVTVVPGPTPAPDPAPAPGLQP